MSTISRLRDTRGRLGGRHIAASLFLHLAAIAAAALLFTRPHDEPLPIEVSIILETGESIAGQGGGANADRQQSQEQASQQQAETAPRPSLKPAAAPRKAAPRASPPKVTPAVQPLSSASTQSPPVVEQTPAPQTAQPIWKNPDDGQTAPVVETGTGAGIGAGQHAAATPGAGAGARTGGAAGGGKAGRGANDYLERVRQALAKHKRYPDQARKLKQEGTARISLVLARDGTVLSAQIANGSGFPLLDEATLQMARDASPVPRVPDDIEGESVKIALPVTFSIGFFGRF